MIGSIPSGVIICRLLVGKDPRNYGSGRTGGSNVRRLAGNKAFYLTVFADILKGMAAVYVARSVGDGTPWVDVLAALGVIVGHNWSLFIGLKGGAGSTPNLGALAMISPPFFLINLILSATLLKITRKASLASLLNTVLTVTAMLFYARDHSPVYLVYGFGQAVLIVPALWPNIKNLLRGTERSIDST